MARFTVFNVNDSGPGSLRQAIIDANDNNNAPGTIDIIRFYADYFRYDSGAITLSSAELSITESVTIDGDIDGDGTADISVQRDPGAGNFRIFNIDDGDADAVQVVTLENLQISGGRGGTGGGIRSRENLSLSNTTVSGNGTTPGSFSNGGGIASLQGTLTLNDSTITGNFTIGQSGEGGGIYSQNSTLVLNNATVSGNSTAGYFSYGGGISISGGTLTLNNATVSGNHTSGNYSDGGGIYNDNATLILNDSLISGNFTSGKDSNGGGIFSDGNTLTLSNSIVYSNHTAGEGSSGGGILSRNGTLMLNHSMVYLNQVDSGEGGGIASLSNNLTVNSSTISVNSSYGQRSHGGGISSRDGSLTITNSTITINRITATDEGYGGGIFCDGGNLTVRNSTIAGNTVVATQSRGGGIYASQNAPILQSNLITGNRATQAVSGDTGHELAAKAGTIISNSNNLFGDETISSNQAFYNFNPVPGSNIIATSDSNNSTPITDIITYQLTDNGGFTLTHALPPNSPAIDAGTNPQSFPTDQRGLSFAREVGNGPDIGAFELQPVVSINATPGSINEGQSSTITVSRSGDTSAPLTVQLSLTLGAGLQSDEFSLSGANLSVISPSAATLLIPGGNSSATFTFASQTDLSSTAEALESLLITLIDGNDYALDDEDSVSLDIQDVDTTVINTDDAGEGSLRQAILNANAVSGADSIDFDGDFIGSTITLSSGELRITESLTIDGDLDNDGSADLTIQRDAQSAPFRIFNILNSESNNRGIALQQVSLNGLIITGGHASDGTDGGGIHSRVDLSLNNSTVSDNTASGEFSNGGGIINRNGYMILNNTTVSNNSADGASENASGGGIASFGGTLILNNSTVYDNEASATTSGEGGGVYGFSTSLTLNNSTVSANLASALYASRGGGISSRDGTLILNNATVTGNNTDALDESSGGGIASRNGNLTLQSSLISGNRVLDHPGDEIAVNGSSISTNHYNLFGHNGIDSAEAFIGFDPDSGTANITATSNGNTPTALGDILLPSGNNGGITHTHALPVGSPAIDAGANPENFRTDQRGQLFVRKFGAGPDIGAFEVQPPPDPNIFNNGFETGQNIMARSALREQYTLPLDLAGILLTVLLWVLFRRAR